MRWDGRDFTYQVVSTGSPSVASTRVTTTPDPTPTTNASSARWSPHGRLQAPPLDPGQILVVGCHGLGATEAQIGSLVPLDVDGVYIALRGPIRRGPDGFGWFDPPMPESHAAVEDAIDHVATFVGWAQIQLGLAADRTVLVGYSQGASLVAAIGSRRVALADHVVLGTAAIPQALGRLSGGGPRRAFIGVGLKDALVDQATLAGLRQRWRAAGTEITSVDYPHGHVMTPREAADISAWIAAGTTPRPTDRRPTNARR